MRVNRVPHTNFVRGEVDPKMIGRTDIRTYQQALKRGRNISLEPQGGCRRRPATTFLYDLATPNVQLAEFVFGEGNEYVFAFMNLQLRIFLLDGTLLQTLVAPWISSQLSRLYWGQSGGTLVVVHPDTFPQRIIRTSSTTFTIGPVPFEINVAGAPTYQPYYKFATDTITLTPSSTVIGAGRTFTLSAAYWVPAHVGMMIRYQGKQCTITGYTSPTIVTGSVDETLPAVTASVVWDEQLFSTVWGYPNCMAFHDQRTIFAGHKNVPDGFWASKVAAPWNHNVGTAADSDAIALTIGSTDLNEIRGIVSGRHLQVLTDNGPFYVPTTDTKPLTPLNCSFRRQSGFGSARVRPRILDGATLYLQKQANVMRELLFDYTLASYTAESVSFLSGHLLSTPINMCVVFGGAAQPNDFAFVLNADGTMAEFQSVRSQELAGWVQWNTDGLYLAHVAVAGNLVVAVQRTIAGVPRYYLEKFDWSADSTLDCATIASNGTPTTIWNGFTQFANHMVHVTGDGYYLGKYTVDGAGQLIIQDPSLNVRVGLDYTVDIESLPVDENLGDGPMTGQPRSILKTTVSLDDTLAMSCNGQPLNLRNADEDFSVPPTPFTGTREFYMQGWSTDPTVKITQDSPVRLRLLSMLWELAA